MVPLRALPSDTRQGPCGPWTLHVIVIAGERDFKGTGVPLAGVQGQVP